MKVVVANIGVGLLIYAWWRYAGREWLAPGLVFGFIILAFGIAIGIWCNQPAKPKRRKGDRHTATSSQPDESAFDQITR